MGWVGVSGSRGNRGSLVSSSTGFAASPKSRGRWFVVLSVPRVWSSCRSSSWSLLRRWALRSRQAPERASSRARVAAPAAACEKGRERETCGVSRKLGWLALPSPAARPKWALLADMGRVIVWSDFAAPGSLPVSSSGPPAKCALSSDLPRVTFGLAGTLRLPLPQFCLVCLAAGLCSPFLNWPSDHLVLRVIDCLIPGHLWAARS